MNITIGQLLFDFMPCRYEYELKVIQKIYDKFGDYHKKHLEDDTWFRKDWITDDIRRRYLY